MAFYINIAKYIKLLMVLLVLLFSVARQSHLQAASLSFIKDTEIEDFLRELLTPLFVSAGYERYEDIKVYVINDTKNINAFVANGKNIFINSSLMVLSDDYQGLLGIVAHELGHIKGAHLTQLALKRKDMKKMSVMTGIAGALGAVLVDSKERVDVVSGILIGGMHVNSRNYLTFRRDQERAADNFAVTLLKRNNVPLDGIISFFEILEDRNRIFIDMKKIDPYILTHPVTRDRLNFFKRLDADDKSESGSGVELDQKLLKKFLKIQAKIQAFVSNDFKESLIEYKNNDDKNNFLRRSILNYRLGYFDLALKDIDYLVNENPNDPYLLEMKAEILLAKSEGKKGVALYYNVYLQLEHSSLINNRFVTLLLQMYDNGYRFMSEIVSEDSLLDYHKDKTILDFVQITLEKALIINENASVWRNFSEFYGRKGLLGLYYFAKAKKESLVGNYKPALASIKKSLKIMEKEENKEKYSEINIRSAKLLEFYIKDKIKRKRKR